MRRINWAAMPKNWLRLRPVRASLIHEPEVSLVHERSALQSVIRALAAEITPGLAAQFLIDQGHQGVKRLVIAVSPIYEQLCYLAGRKSVHIDPGAVEGDARLIA
jgi:hypothetical protein